MANDEQVQTMTKILKFVALELAVPVRKHIFSFASSDVSAKRHHLLAASSFVVENNLTSKPYFMLRDYESLLFCNDENFHHIFRMTRNTIQLLKTFLLKDNLTASGGVTVDKKILLLLWILCNNRSLKEAAEVFRLPEATITLVFNEMCSRLASCKNKLISWPDIKETDEIAESLEYQFGFPGVVGVIGCIRFPISKPGSKVVNSDANNSIDTVTVQIVCDNKLILRDVSSVFIGSPKPSKVIMQTPIYEKLTSKDKPLIGPHRHILGSSAYLQLPTLVTPYPGNNLNEEKSTFNTLHSNTYNLFTQCFNLLQQRFQRLNGLDIETADTIITACCVIHNFSLRNGDFNLFN